MQATERGSVSLPVGSDSPGCNDVNVAPKFKCCGCVVVMPGEGARGGKGGGGGGGGGVRHRVV